MVGSVAQNMHSSPDKHPPVHADLAMSIASCQTSSWKDLRW